MDILERYGFLICETSHDLYEKIAGHMREISVILIRDTIAKLAIEACCRLPQDLYNKIKEASQEESSLLGKSVLQQLVENADLAAHEMMPICQDTGLAVVFADIGQDVHIIGGNLQDAINEGVAKGYTEGYLRASIVEEPLFDRKNTRNNAPAVVHTQIVSGNKLHLLLAPKGAGSENKSAVKMLVPADGIDGVKQFVLETVKGAGSSPCPPMTIGVGLGGTMEIAALCAKKAAIRSVQSHNPNPQYAAFEEELLNMINDLGLGPEGFGGTTTAFKVNVEYFPTHIASLPVAVNINCHAARHAEAIL